MIREPLIEQNNSNAGRTYKDVQIGEDYLLQPSLKSNTNCGQRFATPKVSSVSHSNLVEILESTENSLPSYSSSWSSIGSYKTHPDEVLSCGLKRSNAFDTAKVLQDQVFIFSNLKQYKTNNLVYKR